MTFRFSLLVPILVAGLVIILSTTRAEPPTTGSAAPGQTKGLEDALRNLHAPLAGGNPLPPLEEWKKLHTQDDLTIDLIASEPQIQQPLHISFDERGRMWVVNYRQYPFPAGVKIVEYDRYIRAKFDKVPPPPPHHFKGADKITIHTDDGSGKFANVKVFQDGLNIATSVLHGRGGVWVMNPPYLLFYPDKNRDDVPDADPIVHLSGFGLEDTHSVASNLKWGPDGWIYGTQGSTCTAKVKVEIEKQTKTTDFLGQAIWRYHPEKHMFEIFAEGGGNTFGLEFDDVGRAFSGTNWGKYRGLYYVQGGYYIKGWGKHGPLTNPYALGYFEHMPHTGNADRLTHTYIVYGGGALPERFNGKIIGPNALQRRVSVTRLERDGSSFKTIEEPYLVTSEDGWFRPVDLKAGPDGALYIADLYENRISHVDPRDNWHRESGRIYRVRAKDAKPLAPFDLTKTSGPELVDLLRSKNKWFRDTALRLLYDRKDASLIPLLRQKLIEYGEQDALEVLWALNACGGLDEARLLRAMCHSTPDVRRWAVRLAGDQNSVTTQVYEKMLDMAEHERDSQVRSQLASSAKRLGPLAGLSIVRNLLKHEEDVNDVHIPLLTWWAMESNAETPNGRKLILNFFSDSSFWRLPMVEKCIVERIVQRYAMAGGDQNLRTCAELLHDAPEPRYVHLVLSGLEKAFAGRAASQFPEELRDAVAGALKDDTQGQHLSLGVRVGHPGAVSAALKIVAQEKAAKDRRLDLIRLFGEVSQPSCIPALLKVLQDSADTSIRLTALAALQRYDDPKIAEIVLAIYPRLNDDLRAGAQAMLASRPAWALEFLRAVDAGKIARNLPLEIVRTFKRYSDKNVVTLVEKHWGKVQASTAAEKLAEMDRVGKIVTSGKGDPVAGKVVFTNTCAKCHKLFGEGGQVGPELTTYERDNLRYWLENIVDPSASIRDEYVAFVVETKDGRSLTGIIVAQDKATVSLRQNDGTTIRLAREQIEDLAASPISLMPEAVLKDLKDQQLRDLFAYLMKKR
ncbi:MAG TPA: c-type cytochrome [Gemmataceae bacterium]|nr:c-type cytochrome [Gemmataceae bacterium]